MNLKELDSFKMSDAVTFHDKLNPKLWSGMHLRHEVEKQLQIIAEDFMTELGISGLNVEDITVSGSNAAYSYTPHSDLDLHIIVDMGKLPNDEVYKELFNAKKTLYNDSHDVKVHGVPVELYVQDSREPVKSLGEYSLLRNEWIKFPTKRRANFDQTATKSKFEKLAKVIELALKSKNLDKIQEALKTIKRYRQAGLEKGGEFGPENLAFKAIRSQGLITKLYQLRDELHSDELSIESMYETKKLDQPTLTPEQLASLHGVPKMHILQQLDMGIKIEKEHTTDRETAREIALDHLKEDPNYYTKLQKAELEEEVVDEYKILGKYDPSSFIRAGDRDKPDLMPVNTPLTQFNVRYEEDQDGHNYYFYDKQTDKCVGFFTVEITDVSEFSGLKKLLKPGVRAVTPHMGLAKEVQRQGISTLIYSTFLRGGKWVFVTDEHTVGASRLWDSLVKDDMVTFYVSDETGKPIKQPLSYHDYRVLGPRDRFNIATQNESASGYIPSEKEKNDPRYCMALTVDVKPDTIKKNAKAFGFNVSRAGIPPLLRK